MSLPTIQFKGSQIEISDEHKQLVQDKFEILSKFIGDETDVTCEVEFEKVAPQQAGKIHRVEVNLWLSGTLYRAEATEESFERAIDEVRHELDTLLRRTHKKQENLFRKGARKIKEMMRRGT